MFLAACLVLLCVHTYFSGSEQSQAGAYSITKASEHSPTCMLDNTHSPTHKGAQLSQHWGGCNKSRLSLDALRWKRSYRGSKKALNCLSKERKAYREMKRKESVVCRDMTMWRTSFADKASNFFVYCLLYFWAEYMVIKNNNEKTLPAKDCEPFSKKSFVFSAQEDSDVIPPCETDFLKTWRCTVSSKCPHLVPWD